MATKRSEAEILAALETLARRYEGRGIPMSRWPGGVELVRDLQRWLRGEAVKDVYHDPEATCGS